MQNPIYIGKIRHRDAVYEGEHEGIIPEQLWHKVQERLKANGRTAGQAVTPSPRVSWSDCSTIAQGNRFTPFHADRRGKRYRYYVSQIAVQNKSDDASATTRLPARDIEEVVCCKLQAVLSSPEQLLKATGARSSDAAICKSLIAAGKQLAKHWPSKSIAEQREFLQHVIEQIILLESGLQIVISQPALRVVLLGQPLALGKSTQDLFTITIDVQIKRCGGEVRLVIPSGSEVQMPRRTSLSLIKAVARAYRWPDKIMRGEFQSRQSVAQFADVDQRYAGRILQFAFLAPDIVEAILDGRQPADLTAHKLLRGFPMDWVEQRKWLGFLNARMD